MAPLVLTTLKNSRLISESVSANRGNVLFEARACSNLPHEYAAPFVLNPIFSRLFGQDLYKNQVNQLHGGFPCGIAEDSIGISLIILLITFVGLTVLLWEFVNRRSLNMRNITYDKHILLIGLCIVGATALLIALPPVKVMGVPSPSYILLDITTTWRTLARLYVVVNIAAVALFSIVLAYFGTHFNKYKKVLIVAFLLIFLGIFIEYQAFKPFIGNKLSTFSYTRDVPSVYTWLEKQKDINVIAEYPLERSGGESNAAAYYLSMQLFHKKKLFNGNVPTTYEEHLRGSLKDISDPQTINVLASIGVEAVVIHGVKQEDIKNIEGLEIIYTAKQEKFNMLAFTPLVKNDNVVVARIVKQPNQKNMLSLDKGFVRNATIIYSAANWEYEALNNSELKVVALPGQNTEQNIPTKQCFEVRMAGENEQDNLELTIDGLSVHRTELTSRYKVVSAEVKKSIVLRNESGRNMRVRNLGSCQQSVK